MRAIASPAAALERVLSLLEILHRCSSRRPAGLEVRNCCRRGADSLQIGRLLPLEPAALSVSTCRCVESLRVDLQPVTELSDSQ